MLKLVDFTFGDKVRLIEDHNGYFRGDLFIIESEARFHSHLKAFQEGRLLEEKIIVNLRPIRIAHPRGETIPSYLCRLEKVSVNQTQFQLELF